MPLKSIRDRRAYSKRYYALNKEKCNAAHDLWIQQNKEYYRRYNREYQRMYRKKNYAKCLKYGRDYYHRHYQKYLDSMTPAELEAYKEKRRAVSRKHYWAHRRKRCGRRGHINMAPSR